MTTQTTPPAQPRASQPPSWLPLLALAAAAAACACQAKDPAVDSATTTASATVASDAVSATSTSTSTPDPTTTHALTEATSSASTTGPGPGEECSMWVQDCPPGYKCQIYSKSQASTPDAAHCVPVPIDPKQVDEACGGVSWAPEDLDDCGRGLICQEFVDTICKPACLGDPPFGDGPKTCPWDGWECAYFVAGNGIAGICMQTCDPLMQGCPSGQGCLPIHFAGANEPGFWCMPDYDVPSPPPIDGSPCPCGIGCGFTSACGAERLCVEGGQLPNCQGFCCTSYCDINTPNACALADQGAECVAFADVGVVVPGMEHIGFCGLP